MEKEREVAEMIKKTLEVLNNQLHEAGDLGILVSVNYYNSITEDHIFGYTNIEIDLRLSL